LDILDSRDRSLTALAERQVGRYGDKPFVTWYDDRRGERVELSYKTFDNWGAKTANLLVDELGAGPGDRVGAVLADHWQTLVVLAACWRAGAEVVAVPAGVAPPEGLVAVFVGEEHVAKTAAALAGTGAVLVALTADLLGRSEHDLGRALNFARAVPGMGDLFDGGLDPDGDALTVLGPAPGSAGATPAGAATTPVAATPNEAATMAELLDRAAALAALTGLGDGDRMLSGLPLLSPAGAAAGLLAPFTAGAGVVLSRPFQAARFWKRVADERVAVAVLDPDQARALLAAGPPPPDLDRSRLRVVACQGAEESLLAGFQATIGVPLLG
jgi:uncharacterized protein (TIGR03089 family)